MWGKLVAEGSQDMKPATWSHWESRWCQQAPGSGCRGPTTHHHTCHTGTWAHMPGRQSLCFVPAGAYCTQGIPGTWDELAPPCLALLPFLGDYFQAVTACPSGLSGGRQWAVLIWSEDLRLHSPEISYGLKRQKNSTWVGEIEGTGQEP